MVDNLTGIVLAGGLSTRMGRDKATLPWGKTDLLHTVLAALAPVCTELVVVSNVPRIITLPARVISDSFKGCGPLGGIHAGLTAARCDYSFVVGCDMPYIDSRAVVYMADAARGYDAAAPFINGFFHPLHAIYHQRCFAKIEDQLSQGRYRIADLFSAINTRLIGAAELRQFDSDCGMLRNLNTPEDLSANNYHE